MEEFERTVSLCLFVSTFKTDKATCIFNRRTHNNNLIIEPFTGTQSSNNRITIAVNIGEPPPYEGDIIADMSGVVWAEDRWTEERTIAAEARIRLQGDPLSTKKSQEFVDRAYRFWHEFYKRNQDHFYKDRHYLQRIFPDLLPDSTSEATVRLLEVGCGVGNASLPLLELNSRLHIVAVDFAKSAIDILKCHCESVGLGGRLHAEVCDITKDNLPGEPSTFNFVLCFFVLSAISPTLHKEAVKKMADSLIPGGKLLFRDYGRYDEAQLRFSKGKKLGDNFYVRQDGTCAYYFEIEELRELFTGTGLVEQKCDYVLRQQANRKLQQGRFRVWVECIFVKPPS